jgi:hypothetical protein
MNIFEDRLNCIFCNEILNKTYFTDDKNIFISSNICIQKDNNKLNIPYNISICLNCGCYQNKYLGNINLVYNDNHNNVVISNIWIEHYNQFYNFIIDSNKINKDFNILEIGAGNNYIVELFLKNNYKNYTILEPVITSKIDNVKYIEGWLEDYNMNNNCDIVILSHVFEHLYKPIELFKIKSKYVCLSIPNIPLYINNFILNFLNIEHTFYFEEEHIEILFNNFQYKLINKKYYLDHSIFLLFEYDETLETKIFNNNLIYSINNKFELYFNKINEIILKVNKYTNINNTDNTNKKFAIFPANMYIQYLVCLGLDISNISYYYDNNNNKLDKLLYGTNIICKNLNFFIENNDYEIILLGFLYNKEIIKILEKHNIKYYLPNLNE